MNISGNKVCIAGVSHKTAPVEIRERLAFADNAIPNALDRLRSLEDVDEAFVLSTCNRVEIVVTCSESHDIRGTLESFLAETHAAFGSSIRPYLYFYESNEAIHHLFRVAASLDSMVVGEPQILGQMKAAYALARERGALSGLLDRVMTRAFNVAKRIRTETGIGQTAVSVSYAAVELARKIFGSLDGHSVLLVGAGKMSELSARHLKRSGASNIFVTNRTLERAIEMAALFEGQPIEYNNFLQAMPRMDIVITSSAAPHFILQHKDMVQVIQARRNKPVFLIDIAVPRNVDPAVNDIDNIYLYDIDDLQEVVNTNIRERQKEADRAERIIVDELQKTLESLRVQHVTPTIVSLQEQLEQIRLSELERARRKFGNLTPAQEQAIDLMTRAIVNKIAHGPISELRRRAGDPEGSQVVDAIRRVFQLK